MLLYTIAFILLKYIDAASIEGLFNRTSIILHQESSLTQCQPHECLSTYGFCGTTIDYVFYVYIDSIFLQFSVAMAAKQAPVF